MQALHAVTLPFTYFGIMYFIGNWAPEEIAAELQSFASALAQGAQVLTLLLFGWLVGIMGGQAFFVASGLSALAVVAVWASLRLRPAHAAVFGAAPARDLPVGQPVCVSASAEAAAATPARG